MLNVVPDAIATAIADEVGNPGVLLGTDRDVPADVVRLTIELAWQAAAIVHSLSGRCTNPTCACWTIYQPAAGNAAEPERNAVEHEDETAHPSH